MLKKEISGYIENHTSSENELLHELNRQTHLRTFYPNMLSGKVQGKLLEMIVYMLRPRRILEIGTFTGYSALAMAGALAEGGLLVTIDNNEEIVSFADNVLWGGKAVFNDKRPDKETLGIRQFNEYVAQDKRVEQVMLSVRDGLLLMRKL